MYKGKMGIAIILVLLNFVAFSSCVMDVGNDSVEVSLNNLVPIKGVQMDICDEGDYLTCTGCEPTNRAPGFNCDSNELSDGCVRILLYSFGGDSIDAGTGPLLSLNYDVSDDAPSAECINLTPENILVSDENNNPLNVAVELDEFCIN